MPIWQLSPVDLSDPNWGASSHRGTAIVRAPDEKTAREAAQSAFGVATRFKHHPRLIAPWTRAKLVHASHIEDQRFDPEGPSGVLVPTFEADLAAHPKKPGPVAHDARAPKPSGKRATRDTLKLLAKVRATLRSDPSVGPQFHPNELEIGSDGVLVLGCPAFRTAASRRRNRLGRAISERPNALLTPRGCAMPVSTACCKRQHDQVLGEFQMFRRSIGAERHADVDLHLRQTRSPAHALGNSFRHSRHFLILGSDVVCFSMSGCIGMGGFPLGGSRMVELNTLD